MADGRIQLYLDGLGYPAKKSEVIDTLKENNAPSWMIDTVDKIEIDGKFNDLNDVATTYDHFNSPFS